MELELLVKSLVEAGKSTAEIAEEIVELKEAESTDPKELLSLIKKEEKKHEMKITLETQEKELSEQKEMDAKLEGIEASLSKKLDEKLKSVYVSSTQSAPKINKQWDYKKGEFKKVDDCEFSDGYKKANEMIFNMLNGDSSRAKSISNEIDQENTKYGTKASARSDSDALGGYAIPTEVEGAIQQLTYAQSVMLPLVNRDAIIFENKLYPTIAATTVGYIANQDTAAAESALSFSNPTINMERYGAYTDVSNTLLQQKGADLTSALITAYASANARFIDTQLTIGNITGNSDLIDGLVWQGTQETTPVALASLAISDLSAMLQNIDSEVDPSRLVWIGNMKVMHQIGLLENTGGAYIFPGFASGGTFAPFGKRFVENNKITSVLDVGGDDSTGGTDDALILADLSKFIVGISDGIRLDSSVHVNFKKDQTTFRGLGRIGFKQIFTNTCRVLELTN